MCRSIKVLRTKEESATSQEVYEAALQYVRKVSGYRVPSKANTEVFERAVHEISHATQALLDELVDGRRQPAQRAS